MKGSELGQYCDRLTILHWKKGKKKLRQGQKVRSHRSRWCIGISVALQVVLVGSGFLKLRLLRCLKVWRCARSREFEQIFAFDFLCLTCWRHLNVNQDIVFFPPFICLTGANIFRHYVDKSAIRSARHCPLFLLTELYYSYAVSLFSETHLDWFSAWDGRAKLSFQGLWKRWKYMLKCWTAAFFF